jgi:hypothetical protein
MIRPHHRCVALMLAAAFAVAVLSSCATFKQKVAPLPPTEHVRPPPPAPKAPKRQGLPIASYRDQSYYVHQVRWPNESLELVAQWYTGNRANWKTLARVTPNLHNGRLARGDVVFIPVGLLQIETPMPQQYVQQRRPPVPASSPQPPSGGGQSQPQPYGPRPYPKTTTP